MKTVSITGRVKPRQTGPMKRRVAVPSESPGGLEGLRSDHFGHCRLFTIVDIVDGSIERVETVDNIAHAAGGCMAPVGMLRDHRVDTLVVSGMGKGPLNGCREVGIEVFLARGNEYQDVQGAIRGLLADLLVFMDPGDACQGHGHCHGH